MTTNSEHSYKGWFCKECGTLCHYYEQGLCCDCDSPWLAEKVHEKDYPSKWVKCKVTVEVTGE